jgi:hypothetical protein
VYRSLIFMLIMIVAVNVGATAFYHSTHGVGVLDTAGGANVLDNRSDGYSPEMAYAMIAAYGEQGIRYHLMLTAADMVFPASLAGFFAIAVTYFYSHLVSSRRVLGLLLPPLLYLAADYLENVCIVTMLVAFPTRLFTVAMIANILFRVKNLSGGLSAVIVVAGLSARLLQRTRSLRAG